ncbi:tRNA lysidine(34) synthetase TilS [Buchnera aphidicola]|uniref:tRNA(Ile)-lysidine synthase n=1 Tax=Buchnera aphidicola subsp. Schizaphis graminum (strain Sg) TaxID=198804 RepID=TILS_BUCAP|nr:tRNA lysidine(34) synthetase TilS [Buchnera aphidicola]Q8KA23.1 RecName: Full=tRNA(Ile)-lysidine synthase; AltName: Full=tRNA(Ile)-2-lysyl-cytidine synthase; AltName: Full=tRNA(Ile)-lysidine synthetase [Buchnera aphidicola str. Sg (Schizaphis graminum)]AAM67673.1 putative cell cycle protein MesJ [Buchnera aphidicola str. Sg (Schizaphis graminum)]AWI49830.1 tRNA(Ile)-lysidine synthetase [Buchnera aphidicola (Schizaphis graminum)]
MIEKIINQYQKKLFLIAYSGGIDSTVLLYKMLKIKEKNPQIKIRAIHINHNLHPSSKKWEEHCIKICHKYKIPIITKEIKILLKKNIEETLRIKRYNTIYNYLLNDEILLTGHHLNDQCETLFLSLKRGSGPTGLSGMSIENFLGKKRIVRPFLTKTKKELQKWACENNLESIEDFSNFNIDYDRNFIRHKLIPILEQRWPFFLKNCFRTTVICREETKLKNIFLKEKIQNLINFDESLNIQNFKNINKEVCKALIRYWISLKNIKMPSYKTIECIYNEIICSKKDSNPKIIIDKNEIRRYKTSLYFIKIQKDISNIFLFWHNTDKKLLLPEDLGYLIKNDKGFILPSPKKNELINIRFQLEGKILILGREKRRKIKKIWQEHNIPPWLRNKIPLLFYNNRFISAIGLFVIKEKIINKEKEIQKNWKISWINNVHFNRKNFFLFY